MGRGDRGEEVRIGLLRHRILGIALPQGFKLCRVKGWAGNDVIKDRQSRVQITRQGLPAYRRIAITRDHSQAGSQIPEGLFQCGCIHIAGTFEHQIPHQGSDSRGVGTGAIFTRVNVEREFDERHFVGLNANDAYAVIRFRPPNGW